MNTSLSPKKPWSDPQLLIIDRNLIATTKNNGAIREATGQTYTVNADSYRYLVNPAHTKRYVLSKHGNPLNKLSSFAS